MVVTAPFVFGSLIGFFGSIPVAGPVSATVFKRGLERKFRDGFFTAAGGATAKGLYACLALWGFDAFLSPYPWVKPVSLAVGSAFLLVIGIALLRHRRRPVTEKQQRCSHTSRSYELKSYFLGLVMTLANPTLLATFTALAAILHARGLGEMSPTDAIPFGIGTALGMILWFSCLLSAMKRFRKRLNPRVGRVLVQSMACLLMSLSLWFAWGAYREFGQFVG